MTAPLLPITDEDPIELIRPSVQKAWKALLAKYGTTISIEELDHLFALFVLGMTGPFYEDDMNRARLTACQELLSIVLTAPRIERALRFVPVPSNAWVAKAFEMVEQIGVKNGRSILDLHRRRMQPRRDV